MQTLSIEKREGGKASKLRREGRVPIAIQGRGQETVLASADEVELRRALAASHGQKLMLALGGESAFEVLVRGMDFDAAKGQLLAISAQRVSEDDVVKVSVPIVLDGEPESVHEGVSTLSSPTATVEVKGVLHDIPEEIHVDASQLSEHDKILVSDLHLPEGVEAQTSPDAVVASTTINPAFIEPENSEASEEQAEVAAEEEEAGSAPDESASE